MCAFGATHAHWSRQVCELLLCSVVFVCKESAMCASVCWMCASVGGTEDCVVVVVAEFPRSLG